MCRVERAQTNHRSSALEAHVTQLATLQRRCRDIPLVVVRQEFTEIRLEERFPSEVEKKTERESRRRKRRAKGKHS